MQEVGRFVGEGSSGIEIREIANRKRVNERRVSLVRRSARLEDLIKHRLSPTANIFCAAHTPGTISKSASKELGPRSIPATAVWANSNAGQGAAHHRPHTPPREPFESGELEEFRSENPEEIQDSQVPAGSAAAGRSTDTPLDPRTDPHPGSQAASDSPPASTSVKSIKWGDLGEEEIQNADNDINLSEAEDNQADTEMEERKWRRDVTDEVTDAFMRLPTRTGEPKDEEVEVCHIFNFDALVRIQAENRRWEDCRVVFCTIDMSLSRDTFVQWLYQEVENKAAVQIQHVRILAPRHYLVSVNSLQGLDTDKWAILHAEKDDIYYTVSSRF
ncbi:hypothetical protein R1sor_000336 [Riccia sorocarpa]|uniref:Uncharacterized protein n=1 Tax=Riccia sorocarpa TaxID=122646 RepID=A0ABD3GWT2_9MARC